MKHWVAIIFLVLGIYLVAAAGLGERGRPAAMRVLLSEVQVGALGGQQDCMLVFDDHYFHAERAHRKLGRDLDRKIYEGQLSDADWQALIDIVDAKAFRELQARPKLAPLVISDPHPYTISVARKNGFQNMEFLTKESLKPYESQLKPLFHWWKAVRESRLPESEAPADSRCSLNSNDAVFSN